MNHSLPRRLLLVLLAVLLQVAMLPGQERAACILKTASVTGCCCMASIEPAPAPETGCCHTEELREPVDQQPQTGGRCDCGDDAGDLLASRELLTEAEAAKKNADQHDAAYALLPRHLAAPVLGQSAPPVALRATPPARTGPPLHVLLSVFLI